MEIRLKYRRPSDKEQYVESAFYFVNPDGRWVSERSLPDEVYGPIKKAVLDHVVRLSKWGVDLPLGRTDPLHSIE
jgi:hypothetical protein